jgi:ParB family transcriptional regulator, chromosome partitioning protein
MALMSESQFFNNAIFWVEVDKIHPNPFQPRKEFDESKLMDLAKSIRQYGVIQPLTVSRKEVEREDGGLHAEYELIAGERRLRASKIAGVREVPVLIRAAFDDDKTKLEIAIIENLQREDLNPIDRALAFDRLAKEFGFKHTEIAEKVGKSREYVSNTIRLLMLPEEMRQALQDGKISEGHTRPLLMLTDRKEEQTVLFKEIMLRRLTVRDSEAIARRIATDKVRKKEYMYSPDVLAMEKELTEALGTRVVIEPRGEFGGKLAIDYTSEDDLRSIFNAIAKKLENSDASTNAASEGYSDSVATESPETASSSLGRPPSDADLSTLPNEPIDDRSKEEKEADENTFNPNSFSI